MRKHLNQINNRSCKQTKKKNVKIKIKNWAKHKQNGENGIQYAANDFVFFSFCLYKSRSFMDLSLYVYVLVLFNNN